MKIFNSGAEFTILGFIVQNGINFLTNDFMEILKSNPKELKRWQKLIDKGVIKVL